ncbi:MAG: NAD-dependent epimerase/dehydratase family protein [Myxococcota bacterium]
MGQRVLVTGGTGFVATWCLVELLRQGHEVRTTVRDLRRAEAVRAAVVRAGADGAALTFAAADLGDDAGWDAAVAGCDAVLHVASPMGAPAGAAPEALIAPARDGTLRVLRAARRAGVSRVVATSSLAAAMPSDPDGTGDESVWTDPSLPMLNVYCRSKIFAERAAWDFVRSPEGDGLALTTLLPGAIFGPPLQRAAGSVEVIQRLLDGRPPLIPRIALTLTDVRDLAAVHVHALSVPEAAGERFVVAGDRLWMADVARILREGVGDRAPRIPTRTAPDWLVRAAARFLPPLRELEPLLGRRMRYASDKARRVLGYAPRPPEETLGDCARALLDAADALS